MNAYRYKSLSRDGAPVNGVLQAFDEFEAVAQIKREGGIVLKVEEVKGKREKIDLNEPLWVSEKVLSLTAAQFSILLRSGLPMVRTVEIISQQTQDRLMKKILRQVAQDVSAGYGLAPSFESRGKKIPVTFIETIRAGEESGTLETCFSKLEAYYQKSYKTKAKVKGALIYPAFLCVLATIVIGVVVTVAVPTFAGIIDTGGGEMPLPTALLLGLSDFLAHWWGLLLALLCAIAVSLRLYGRTDQGHRRLSHMAMRMPILGRVNVMNGASQLANTLSTLLSAGLPMTRAVVIVGRVLNNYSLGLTVGATSMGLEEGKRLGDVLRGNPYLPPLLTEMIAVGEDSGALEETLDTIGAYYDSEVETASARVLSMLEPTITVVMGIVIAFIVVALYLPMFQSYSYM